RSVADGTWMANGDLDRGGSLQRSVSADRHRLADICLHRSTSVNAICTGTGSQHHRRHCVDHRRYHESLDNFTPAGVCFGRSQTILDSRAKTNQKTMALRRQLHQKSVAWNFSEIARTLPPNFEIDLFERF
ncbi:MAG: hypothetical protein WBM65_10535, partial [Sedimenticolaceae bacterium]